MFKTVFESIFSLCVMMAAGFFFSKRGPLSDTVTAGLSSLLINLCLPCLILTSMQREYSASRLNSALLCPALFAAAIVLSSLAGWAYSGAAAIKSPAAGVYIFAAGFPNVVYMGFPVIEYIFGKDGMFYAVMCSLAFNLLCYTLGLKVMGGKGGSLRKTFLNPPAVASIIGFGLFAASLRIYAPLNAAMVSVGGMTTPVSMLVVGAMLAKTHAREVLADWRVYPLAALRLLVLPLAAFIILRGFIASQIMLSVITLMAGMPAAAVTVVLAGETEGDVKTAGKLVFVTTVLAVITLPVLFRVTQLFSVNQ